MTELLGRAGRPGVRKRGLVFGTRGGIVSSVCLVVIALLAVAAPLVAGQDPTAQDPTNRLMPPIWDGGDWQHAFGTDQLGRDTFSRILYGGRVSLLVGFSAVAVASTLGLMIGLVSGYAGGRVDLAIQSVAYAQLAMPFVVLAIAFAALFGPSLPNVLLVLVITGWVPFARLVRGSTLAAKRMEFVEAAHMMGASHLRIVSRHVFPQVLNSFLALAGLQVGWMILLESALSYLGLGVQPPTPTWGGMINDGRNYISIAPWMVVLPGLAIAVTVVCVNSVAAALTDALDPRRGRNPRT